ncbi:hypothetical protein D3C76_357920 [compost metagenome]
MLGQARVHQHAGAGAVGQLAGVAGGDAAAVDHGFEFAQVIEHGLRAIAFVLGQGDLLETHGTGGLVDHLLGGCHRHDLIGEQAGLLRGSGAPLRLQGVGILGFAADVVALGDDFGGLQHGHIGVHGIAHHELVALGHGPFHVALLHQADVFLAGTDSHLHAIDHDLLGGRGNRHQARGALAVQGLAADAVGQAAGQCRHAAQVPASGTAGHGGAHDQVIDFTGFDTGTDHRGTDRVAGHAR